MRRGENIHKRADGRWEARVLFDPICKKYKYLYGKTYMEVKKKKSEFQKGLFATKETKNTVEPLQPMMMSDLCKDWLQQKRSEVKPSTYSKYCRDVQKHIIKHLGNLPVSSLSEESIKQFKVGLCRLDKKGELSSKTINDVIVTLKQIIRYGRKRSIITKEFDFPNSKKTKQNEVIVLSRNDEDTMIKYLYNNIDMMFNVGILLALTTGMRIGEICALQGSDINIAEQSININKTLQRIENTDSNSLTKTKIIIDKPKSDASIRIIPIPFSLITVFSSKRIKANCYVLTGTRQFIEPRRLEYYFEKVLEQCNINHIKFHVLRHTFATRAIKNSMDIKTLSAILGHADVATTYNLYVHPTLEDKIEAVEMMASNY